MKSTLIAATKAEATPRTTSASAAAPFSAELSITPRRGTETFAAVLRRIGPLLSFAQILWSIVTAPFEFYRWVVKGLFGGVFEDGEINDPCELCSDPSTGYKDGHPPGVQCPHAMQGHCLECLALVDLDRFGFCVVGGGRHWITNRRPKPQPRLHIVRSNR